MSNSCWGEELEELPGEHRGGCICPSASHPLGCWASCWAWLAKNKQQLLHSSKLGLSWMCGCHLPERTNFLKHSTRIWGTWVQLSFIIGGYGHIHCFRTKGESGMSQGLLFGEWGLGSKKVTFICSCWSSSNNSIVSKYPPDSKAWPKWLLV